MILRPLHNELVLLRQLSENHEPAFRQLYEGYAPGVYAVALQHLKLPHLAEDIVQSVFLKLWENRSEVLSIQHFASWFYTITRNSIISALRKQGSIDAYRNYLKERMEISQDSPELQMLKKEQITLIREAVAQLSPQQRTAFLLQREEGLSYEAIGKQMGIATNTVKVHLYKAMESIRHYVMQHSKDSIALTCLLLFLLMDKNIF